MKEKMLYLMHVPWGYIKQRPHFVGEYLSGIFDVSIYCLRHTQTRELADNKLPDNIKIGTLWVSNMPGFVNAAIVKYKLRAEIKKSKYIWVTFPKMYDFIKGYLKPDQVLIYDCMDDALEFPGVKKNVKKRNELIALEKELCARSNIIYASAEHLKDKLLSRYKIEANILVVNNGIHLTDVDSAPSNLPAAIDHLFDDKKVTFTYIGTIAEWLDFDIVLKSLTRYQNLQYIFVGCNHTEKLVHERVKYTGPIEHKYIFEVMRKSDALTMPFILNDLVLSVNPVKVYEYIYSCRPTIIKKYCETEQFGKFVYLYGTNEEYFHFIHDIITKEYKPKQSDSECIKYAENNTWEHRIEQMVECIRKY